VLLATLAACGGADAPARGGVAGGPSAAVRQEAGFPRFFQGPAYPGGVTRADLLDRWLDQLAGGSRDGLRFAQARIAELGPSAAPRITERLREVMGDSRRFGVAHNLCEALSRTGDEAASKVLAEVLEATEVPVLRSAAVEGITRLGDRARVPDLIRSLERESETSVVAKILEALATLGGDEAGQVLEDAARGWLEGDRSGTFGMTAWNAVLNMQDAGAGDRLARLQDSVPAAGAPLRLQTLFARVALGEPGLGPALKEFLDAETYPSPRVRVQAVAALAEVGDWAAVLAAADDPDPMVQLAVLGTLRRPDAAAADLGRPLLERLAREVQLEQILLDEDALNIAANACAALRQRGAQGVLEPWLRALRGYPNGAGSREALRLLREEPLHDPRTSAILESRWGHCDFDARVDLLRTMSVLGFAESVPFFERVASDRDTDPELRRLALTLLANFGQAAAPAMFALWDGELSCWPGTAEDLLHGIGRLALEGDPRARAMLIDLVSDRRGEAFVRRIAIDLLPKALGADAWETLLAARDAESDRDARAYLDRALLEFY